MDYPSIILVTHSEGFGKMLKYITKNNKLNPRAQMLNSAAEDANSRMQRRIRVLFAHNPPEAFDNCRRFPTMNPSMECPFPGYCVEIVNYLAQYLGLRIEPTVVNNAIGELDWGNYENGNWTGALGLIQNGTVETACLFFQRTQLRAQFFAFSYPVTNVKPSYVVHSRPEQWNIWNAFTPYAPSTWMAMGLMLALQTLFCVYVARLEVRMGRRQHLQPCQVFWKILRLQLYQPDTFDFRTAAGNFAVLVFTIMQCRLLLDMYQTLLLSALLQPTPANPFRDAQEMVRLIASQQFKLITNYIGNWYFEELHNSNVSHYRSLRIAIANNPIHVAASASKALDRVEEGGFIYPIQEDSIAMQLAKQRCGLVFVSEGLPEVSAHFVFQRGSPLAPLFERAIAMNLDFIRRTFNKYLYAGFKLNEGTKACPFAGDFQHKGPAAGRWHLDQSGIELKPLNLTSMFGVMMVALFGLAMSLAAFSAEVYYQHKKEKLLLRLRMRRALAEQAHLTAAAQIFVKANVQAQMEQRLQCPTLGELQAIFGEVYI